PGEGRPVAFPPVAAAKMKRPRIAPGPGPRWARTIAADAHSACSAAAVAAPACLLRAPPARCGCVAGGATPSPGADAHRTRDAARAESWGSSRCPSRLFRKREKGNKRLLEIVGDRQADLLLPRKPSQR